MEAGSIENLTPVEIRRKCIIVSGMHRSGTSALTRVLNMMGGTLPQTIMPATEFNLSGHFESKTLSFLNEAILVDLGLSWSSIDEIDWPSLEPERCAGYRKRISDAIVEEFPDGSLLVIKDPRISRLLPLWKPVLDDLAIDTSFVVPVRHPLEVADSLKRRDEFPLEMGCLLWLRYVLEAELNTRGLSRAFASYSNLLSAPSETLAQFLSAFGSELPVAIADAEPDIESFLDPALRHHVAELAELNRIDSLYPWIERTYRAYVKLIANPHDTDAQAQLDRVHDEFRNFAEAFVPLVTFERRQSETVAEKMNGQLAALQQQLTIEAAQHASVNAQLVEQTSRAESLETQLVSQIARIGEIEQALALQVARITETEQSLALQIARNAEVEQALAAQAGRTIEVEQSLSAQTARTALLESQLGEQIAATESISDLLTYQKSQTAAVQQIANTQAAKVIDLEHNVAERGSQIQAIMQSHSWRLTAPMRAVKRLILRLTGGDKN